MPKVSILLPTYNGAQYVVESIESVIRQSFNDWELIIIDDASTDNIGNIIKEFIKNYSRIIFIQNDKNLGLAGNLNKGISISKGEYIARIDQDDIWIDSDKLKKQVEFLDKNMDCVLIGTGYKIVDENGMFIRDVKPLKDDQSIRKNILLYNPFGHSTVVFRKQPVLHLKGYNSKIKYGEDYDLWLRLGQKGSLANIEDICMQYRMCNGMSQKHNKWKQIKFHSGLLLRYGIYYPGLPKAIIQLIIYAINGPLSLIKFQIKKLCFKK
ncbi:MAG: hypothetical protein US50_C0067G0008 [Candidatus Nomurabacteria bacterium GW2011_GWB1_37_5]|uniref:Glycosyltransferase 2-like domain-containing protein n=1 Tax=Candidatus Nomurabacteria bacterium GW2011_GWB1_37_5 TaxID=1618742 RepID=A0A0G0H5Z2_9BACT|nr:MAG: hypothetical protein US50_C0067G0008 [Candidatus Nomurabacteria bacterium GW2011_GWB1_37_5]